MNPERPRIFLMQKRIESSRRRDQFWWATSFAHRLSGFEFSHRILSMTSFFSLRILSMTSFSFSLYIRGRGRPWLGRGARTRFRRDCASIVLQCGKWCQALRVLGSSNVDVCGCEGAPGDEKHTSPPETSCSREQYIQNNAFHMHLCFHRPAVWPTHLTNFKKNLWEGCRARRGYSRDTYPESYITKYTSIRRYTGRESH